MPDPAHPFLRPGVGALDIGKMGQNEFTKDHPIAPEKLRAPEPGQARQSGVAAYAFQVIAQAQIVRLISQKFLDRPFQYNRIVHRWPTAGG